MGAHMFPLARNLTTFQGIQAPVFIFGTIKYPGMESEKAFLGGYGLSFKVGPSGIGSIPSWLARALVTCAL